MFAFLLGLSAATMQPPAPSTDLREACPSLASRLDPGTFAKAQSVVVEAKGAMPAYCRVRGTIKPTIGFEMRLPLSGWNGNYYVSGCGGYCGLLTTETPGWANGIVDPVKRGYAAIHTDSGHPGPGQDYADWAPGNRQALELYAGGWLPLAHGPGWAWCGASMAARRAIAISWAARTVAAWRWSRRSVTPSCSTGLSAVAPRSI